MTRRPDPAWFRLADRSFAAALWLFPESLRAAHGEEMRQAFRDRCRDFAAGRVGAWQLFARELCFDSARAAIGAHLEAGVGPIGPRHVVLLLALLVTGVLMVKQDTTIGPVVRAVARVDRMAPFLKRELDSRRDEIVIRDLGDTLAARAGVDDRALGAWLLGAYPAQRLRYSEGRRQPDWLTDRLLSGRFYAALPAQGRRATVAALSITPDASPFALAVAAEACRTRLGCLNHDLLRKLARADAGNAHAAFQQFGVASAAGDEAGMAAALVRAAAAGRHDDYQVELRRRALRAAVGLYPNDDQKVMSVARRLNYLPPESNGVQWDDNLRSNCNPIHEGYRKRPPYLARHPEYRDACAAIGRLLSRSRNPFVRHSGWWIGVGLGTMSKAEAMALDEAWNAQRPRVGWLRVQRQRDDPPGVEWTAAEWAEWARKEAAAADG